MAFVDLTGRRNYMNLTNDGIVDLTGRRPSKRPRRAPLPSVNLTGNVINLTRRPGGNVINLTRLNRPTPNLAPNRAGSPRRRASRGGSPSPVSNRGGSPPNFRAGSGSPVFSSRRGSPRPVSWSPNVRLGSPVFDRRGSPDAVAVLLDQLEDAVAAVQGRPESWEQRAMRIRAAEGVVNALGKTNNRRGGVPRAVADRRQRLEQTLQAERAMARPLLLNAHGRSIGTIFQAPAGVNIVFLAMMGTMYFDMTDFSNWDTVHRLMTNNVASFRPNANAPNIRVPVHKYKPGQFVPDLSLVFTPNIGTTGIHALPLDAHAINSGGAFELGVAVKTGSVQDVKLMAKIASATYRTLVWDPRDPRADPRIANEMHLSTLAKAMARRFGKVTLFVAACRGCRDLGRNLTVKLMRNEMQLQRNRQASNLLEVNNTHPNLECAGLKSVCVRRQTGTGGWVASNRTAEAFFVKQVSVWKKKKGFLAILGSTYPFLGAVTDQLMQMREKAMASTVIKQEET